MSANATGGGRSGAGRCLAVAVVAVAVLLLGAAATGRAAPPAASPADTIRVTLDHGADRYVAYVEYVSLGTVRLVGANGRSREVDGSRIIAIEGPAGQDLTSAVMERPGYAGTPPVVWLRARKEPGFRLVARPLPECTSFALTEIGILVPLRTATKTDQDRSPTVVLDYGWMKNLEPHHAVGFVVHADLGTNRLRLGPAVRYRRWFTQASAIDVAAGVLVAGLEDATNYDFDGPALFGQVDYEASGLIALTGQIETTALRYQPPAYVPVSEPSGSGVDVRFGAKLGAGLGIVGTIALTIPIVAVVVILSNGVD